MLRALSGFEMTPRTAQQREHEIAPPSTLLLLSDDLPYSHSCVQQVLVDDVVMHWCGINIMWYLIVLILLGDGACEDPTRSITSKFAIHVNIWLY